MDRGPSGVQGARRLAVIFGQNGDLPMFAGKLRRENFRISVASIVDRSPIVVAVA